MRLVRLNAWLSRATIKPAVWLLCLLPLATLGLRLMAQELGPNPAETLLRSTGDWALRGLCLVLTLTPLQQGLGLTALGRLRRLLGLFSFFYAVLHALIYAWLEVGWQWQEMWQDVLERPFITVGMLAWLLLAVLAATSFQAAIRTLGGKRWKRVHRTVHLAAWLVLLHFYWMREGKNNTQEVWYYVAVIAALQAWRLWRWHQRRRMQSAVRP